MKYFILGLLTLPLVTACVTAQEEYYGPYGTPPSPRAELSRYAHYGDRSHLDAYEQRGSYRSTPGHAVARAHGQRGVHAAPQNTHGHDRAVRIPQYTHGHPSVGASKTERHPSQQQFQDHVHGHR